MTPSAKPYHVPNGEPLWSQQSSQQPSTFHRESNCGPASDISWCGVCSQQQVVFSSEVPASRGCAIEQSHGRQRLLWKLGPFTIKIRLLSKILHITLVPTIGRSYYSKARTPFPVRPASGSGLQQVHPLWPPFAHLFNHMPGLGSFRNLKSYHSFEIK